MGTQIRNGLDNDGDKLILKDKNGVVVDQLSWGLDISIFNLTGIIQGHSLEHNPDGKDFDLAADFIDRTPPTPDFNLTDYQNL